MGECWVNFGLERCFKFLQVSYNLEKIYTKMNLNVIENSIPDEASLKLHPWIG